MESNDRIGAAYHEAGHAIVAWVFGLTIAEVAIGIDGDDAAGRTKIIGTDDHLTVFDRVVLNLAGLEAQEIFEAPTHDNAGLGDFAKIIDLLYDVSEEESAKIRAAARQRAHEIILANRSKVARLAQRLLTDESIDGATFVAIVGACG
jgi:ATP-dependent Zn protease